MKKVLIAVCAVLLLSSFALAAQPKSYQVTGPVLEVTSDTVTVQKGNEKWEIARDKDTKVTGGDPKVGSKVTIMYKRPFSFGAEPRAVRLVHRKSLTPVLPGPSEVFNGLASRIA